MNSIDEIGLLPMGRILVTEAANSRIPPEEMLMAILKHGRGEWGDISDEDRAANSVALNRSLRVVSQCRASNGTRFWIITEHDRSHTTILLPNEY